MTRRPLRLLYAYKSVTLGGVERMLLNRAWALAQAGREVVIDLLTPADARPAADAFRASVDAFGLTGRLNLVEGADAARGYAAAVCIDHPPALPALLALGRPVAVEAHAAHLPAQAYLRDLPTEVRVVVTPSAAHAAAVAGLAPPGATVMVVQNVVAAPPVAPAAPSAPPILAYAGRMGPNKNTAELVRLFAGVVRERPARLVVASPTDRHAETEAEIDRAGVRALVEVRRDVPFHALGELWAQVAASGGVFVSCSRGESFGLAAAEAIVAGLPVALSDVTGHRELVGGDTALLYPLCDADAGAARVLALLADPAEARARLAPARRRLSDAAPALAGFERVLRALGVG